MRVYNESVLNDLQKAIDSGSAKWERQEYGFLNLLDIAGVRIKLYYDERLKMRMGENVISDYTIDTNYMRNWRAFPPGKYLIKDWRKDVLNKDGLCPYIVIKWTSDEQQNLRAILRELLEDDKDEPDVKLEGVSYKVIKIVDADEVEEGWLSFEPKVRDISHCVTLVQDDIADDDDIEEDIPEVKEEVPEEKPNEQLNTLFD